MYVRTCRCHNWYQQRPSRRKRNIQQLERASFTEQHAVFMTVPYSLSCGVL